MATKAKTSKARETVPVAWNPPPGADGYLTEKDIARLLRIGITQMKEMIRDGVYPPRTTTIGKRPRWSVEDHNNWCRQRNARA